MLTPIHRALGVEPGPLTADLIRQAVSAGVKEADDLDWKSGLYHPKQPDWRDEAAKDIAAMANSGGGWIVFGVEDADDAAAGIAPVRWSGGEEQRLRQLAYAHIGPPVIGLGFTVLDVEDGSVVAVRVPDSAEAPHLARKGNDAFVAPRRNGPHTVFMSERELERGYRVRFRTRTDRDESLARLYQEAANAINPHDGVCLVFAAVPREPRTQAPAMSEEQARGVLGYVDHDPYYGGMSVADGSGDYRRGLRSWVVRDRSDRPWRKTLHEDGTVTVAYRLGGWNVGDKMAAYYPQGERNHCLSEHVEQAIAEGVACVAQTATTLVVHGGYTARGGLVGRDGEPIYVRTTGGMRDQLLDVADAEPIHDFHPVTVELDPFEAEQGLLSLMREMSLDIVNQGGVSRLKALHRPASAT